MRCGIQERHDAVRRLTFAVGNVSAARGTAFVNIGAPKGCLQVWLMVFLTSEIFWRMKIRIGILALASFAAMC